jgi:hypothetical protein
MFRLFGLAGLKVLGAFYFPFTLPAEFGEARYQTRWWAASCRRVRASSFAAGEAERMAAARERPGASASRSESWRKRTRLEPRT